MLQILISVAGILLTIFFVIGTHEAAHFAMARMVGVKVLRFSIGFGKTLFHWYDKKGTEYVFALIPLGGYVKMLDESEGNVPKNELQQAYNRQPFYKKFLIVLAGPVTNLLCAFVLYWLIFMIGVVVPKPVVGTITPNSIAATAGLKSNQEILSIDDKPTATWTKVLFRLLSHAGNQDNANISVQNLADKKIATRTLDLSAWHMDALSPEPLQSLGITPFMPDIPLVIGIIKENSPASASPLKVGDKVISINSKPIKNWEEFVTMVMEHPGESFTFVVERQGKKTKFPVTIGTQHSLFGKNTGFLGTGPNFQYPKELLHKIQLGPIAAIPYAWQETVDLSYFNLLLMGKLVTGKLSLQSLGGPITIFESAGEALNYGIIAFLGFLAFLSIAIGIINLLPIPGLDGGHLLIQTIESIIGKPIPETVLINLYRAGFLLLFFVLIQSLINDVLRLA